MTDPPPHFKKKPLGSPTTVYSSEASTYSAQDSLKVWVFKQAFLDNTNPDNTSGLKMVDARPIIECVEVFPKRPSQQDLSFDILWSELSDEPNERPDSKFTVQLELLPPIGQSCVHTPGKAPWQGSS